MKTTEQVVNHTAIFCTHIHILNKNRRAETWTSQGMSALLVQDGVASMERLTRHFMATTMAQLNLPCDYDTT